MKNIQVVAILLVAIIVAGAVGYVAGQQTAPVKEVSVPGQTVETTVTATMTVTPEKKLTHVTFRLDWAAAAQQSPWYLGKAEGYFEQEGIDLEIISGDGSASSIKLTAEKKVDFALCDTLVLVQGIANNGMPVKSVAVYYTKTPISIISLKESKITTLKDLVGKKVGTKIGSTTYQGLIAVLKANGIDPEKDIQLVSVGFGVQPLLAKQVDALMAFTMNEATEAVEQGYEINEMMISDYGVQLYGLTVITHTDTLRDKPELVKSFLRASVRSIEHTLASPHMAIATLLKAVPDLKSGHEMMAVDKMIAGGIIQDEVTTEKGIGFSTLEKWSAAQDIIFSVGLIEKKVDANLFFTNDFLT